MSKEREAVLQHLASIEMHMAEIRKIVYGDHDGVPAWLFSALDHDKRIEVVKRNISGLSLSDEVSDVKPLIHNLVSKLNNDQIRVTFSGQNGLITKFKSELNNKSVPVIKEAIQQLITERKLRKSGDRLIANLGGEVGQAQTVVTEHAGSVP